MRERLKTNKTERPQDYTHTLIVGPTISLCVEFKSIGPKRAEERGEHRFEEAEHRSTVFDLPACLP